jgi:hypothetical protein
MDLPLKVISNSLEIAKVIDAFPSDYHADFSRVRAIARKYLEWTDTRPPEDTATGLAKHLRAVLINWGAGKRGAPHPSYESEIATFLCDARLRVDLANIANAGLASLSLNMQRRIVIDGAEIKNPKQFDDVLLSVLVRLSNGLFFGNTNVTYPMKAALLITGLMPAFDSQVRRGLNRAGFSGVNKTQFLLPLTVENNSDGMKLTRLPFILGHCWAEFSDVFSDVIRRSPRQN